MTCMSVENSEQEEALTNKLSLLNVCLDATEDQAEVCKSMCLCESEI